MWAHTRMRYWWWWRETLLCLLVWRRWRHPRTIPLTLSTQGQGSRGVSPPVTRDQFGTGRSGSNLSNSLSINEKSPWRWQNHDYVIPEKVDLKQSHPQQHSHRGKGRVVLVTVTQEGKCMGLPSLNRLSLPEALLIYGQRIFHWKLKEVFSF